MMFYITHGYCGKGKTLQYHIHKSDKCFYPVGDKNHVEHREKVVGRCNEAIKQIVAGVDGTVILYDGLKRVKLK